jgi:hypothetical protein
LTSGYQLAFLVAAGLVVAAIVVALAVFKSDEQVEAAGSTDARPIEATPVYLEAA